MIGLLTHVELSVNPPFAFPGERFFVSASAGAEVSSNDVDLKRREGGWAGVAPAVPPEIWAILGPPEAPSDAAKIALPIAQGLTMTLQGIDFTVVALYGGGYGAILRGKRFADLVAFDLAPRSAPLRRRQFNPDYVYSSPNRITISGVPGGLLRATVTITPSGMSVEYSTLFDLSGSLLILDTEFAIVQMPPASVQRVNYLFANSNAPMFRDLSHSFANSPDGVSGARPTAAVK